MSVTRVPGPRDRAVMLLGQIVAEEDGFSRVNIINKLGGVGHAARQDRRDWAEAWEILRRAGLICPEPHNPKEGDWWFVTGSGRHAVDHDPDGEIQRRLPGG